MIFVEKNTTMNPIDPIICGQEYSDGTTFIMDHLPELMQEEDNRQANLKHPYVIRDIFKDHPECWSKDSGVSLRPEQYTAAWCIANCKTRGMNGFTASYCPKCGYKSLHYKSCCNRNCPSCQLPTQMQWVEDRKKEVIPDQPYYHIIFTSDHRLTPLFYANQKTLYGLYSQCASSAIIDLCNDPHYLGATPGIISVLHTWRQDLLPHVHLHCIVSGCGLTKDKKFVSLLDVHQNADTSDLSESCTIADSALLDDDDDSSNDAMANCPYFLPMEPLTNLFRNKFMDKLRDLWKEKKLVIPNSHPEWNDFAIWSEFCKDVSSVKWVGKIVNAFHGKGEVNAIDYLARYVFRTAISNNRITDYDGKNVTFRVRDNDHPGQHKDCKLSAEEFIRRYLFHVLDARVPRVRYAGFLSCNSRSKNLRLIAEQLQIPSMLEIWAPKKAEEASSDNCSASSKTSSWKTVKLPIEQTMFKFYRIDVCQCPNCNSPLVMWPPKVRRDLGFWRPKLSPEKERIIKFKAARKRKIARETWAKIKASRERKRQESAKKVKTA